MAVRRVAGDAGSEITRAPIKRIATVVSRKVNAKSATTADFALQTAAVRPLLKNAGMLTCLLSLSLSALF